MAQAVDYRTRRKLRISLGSRYERRKGTKTKAMPGITGINGMVVKYKYPHPGRHVEPPRLALRRKIDEFLKAQAKQPAAAAS